MTRWEAATALLLASAPGFQTPSRTARMLAAWVRWRRHPVGALVAAAAWYPERAAIVDDEGSLTFAEFEARSNAIARAWREREIGPGTIVGLLCRDSRLFFDSSVAAQKLGADLVYVNVAFSPPQVAGVVEDEGIDALVYDDSLADAASEANPRIVVTEDELRAAAG